MEFTVNDTSPTILYTPFGDTFSTPNLSAGWNPYYTNSGFASTPGEVGDGTSLHITSNNGSSLLVQWHGTGIQLWGNATSASYAIMLDGAPFTPVNSSDSDDSLTVLANITGLPDAPHAVTLTAVFQSDNPPNSSMIVFEKAVITPSPTPANVSCSPQNIDDNDIAFLGRWSFRTAPSGTSFHSSQTLGDRVVTKFNGTTFLLQGITSPSSGNYTVTLDNVTTSLSARSSFTSYNSLLFFATGLDPLSTHLVQVTNSGDGHLALVAGGFTTFMPSNALSPSPSSSIVTARPSFSQGTIAAFVLAGILAFVIFSALIFYFLVYRPRRQRQHKFRRTNHKEHEAGVIDIGPEVDKTADFYSPFDLDEQHSGVSNGLSRWRRGAVEGSPGALSLPLQFRHSDSVEKLPSPLNDIQLGDLSKSSSDSSTRRKAQAKRKGKARQIIGRSWSPGITFDLPIRHSRRQSSIQPLSPGVESVGPVSTFIAAEPSSPRNLLPPSYAASISIRDSNSHTNLNFNNSPSSEHLSNMPSVPRSVSLFPGDHSYPRQNQDYTGGFVLRHGDLISEQGSSAGSSPHRLKPPQTIPRRSQTRHDRGSVIEDNLDDNEDIPLQQAIRSLSPRTVRHPYAYQDQDSIQVPPSPQEINLPEENPVLTLLPETPSNDDDLVEVRDGVFLSVRTPSPFHLTFDTRRSNRSATDKSNSGELSYLPASPHSRLSHSFEPPNPDDGTSPAFLTPTDPEILQGTSNMRLRLPPLAIPPTPVVKPPFNTSDVEVSEGVTSFLDFTSSRHGSLASRSVKTTWSEERQRNSLYPTTVEGKSRWSNTTVPSLKSKSSTHGNGSSGNDSSDSSRKVSSLELQPLRQSSTFPTVRVSIPPSAHHTMGSNRRFRTSGSTQTGDILHVHPFEGLESPTESAPMSVSELRFRQSVEEESMGIVNSRRTTDSSLVFVSSSHPPLPTRPDEFVPRPFDPSILVNRVLGLSPTISVLTARPNTGYHSAGSPASSRGPFASSPNPFAPSSSPLVPSHSPFAESPFISSIISPFASRYDSDIHGDRSNFENSELDSSGPSSPYP